MEQKSGLRHQPELITHLNYTQLLEPEHKTVKLCRRTRPLRADQQQTAGPRLDQ